MVTFGTHTCKSANDVADHVSGTIKHYTVSTVSMWALGDTHVHMHGSDN